MFLGAATSSADQATDGGLPDPAQPLALHNVGGSVPSVTNWHWGREIESLNIRFQPTRF
jgi:hypothetical protein